MYKMDSSASAATSDINNLPNELNPSENVKMTVNETGDNKSVITELSKESISQIK